MDARGWNGEPDARDDRNEHDGHTRIPRRLQFGFSCDALVLWIRTASDPSVPLWAPYRGDAQQCAIWYAQHCYREARALGLYPSRDVLESERVAAESAPVRVRRDRQGWR